MIKNLPAMQETQVRSLGQEDTAEKRMVIHSSNLASRSAWTKEPGGLQSMGCKESGKTEQLTLTQPWKGTKHNFTHQSTGTESLSPGSLHKPPDQPHPPRGRHHRQEVL